MDAGAAHVFPLYGIDVTHTHQNTVVRTDFRRKIQNVCQLCWTQSHDGGQRHAVDVSARGTFWRVDVGVSVDPDEPDFFILTTVKFGNSRDCARAYGVVASEYERHDAFVQSFDHQVGLFGTSGGDFL